MVQKMSWILDAIAYSKYMNSYREAKEPEVDLLPVKHIQIRSLTTEKWLRYK